MKARRISFLALLLAGILLSGCSEPENSGNGNIIPDETEKMPVPTSASRPTGEENKTNSISAPMEKNPTPETPLRTKYDSAIIKTNLGNIKVALYAEDAPLTVENFLKLSESKFYDNTKFHRVIKDFMIQGGDPLSKDEDWSNDGTGGPGYTFKDEINPHKIVRGSLAMANSGPNTNGSQFFIVTAAATPWLDGRHTNFGAVIEGMDIIDTIENMETDENDHPLKDAAIQGIELIKRGQ